MAEGPDGAPLPKRREALETLFAGFPSSPGLSPVALHTKIRYGEIWLKPAGVVRWTG